MALAWCVSVRLKLGWWAGVWSYALSRAKIGKFSFLGVQLFHLSLRIYVDNLASTRASDWQKCWSEVTDEENVVYHQKQVKHADHSHGGL